MMMVNMVKIWTKHNAILNNNKILLVIVTNDAIVSTVSVLILGVTGSELAVRGDQKMGIRLPFTTAVAVQQRVKLNRHQRWLLEQLQKPGDFLELPKKMLGPNDMIKLSAHERVEFALFTRWGRRILMRGDITYVPFTPGMAKKWAKRGWRWSGHTHPHKGNIPLTPSSGVGKSHDAAVLWRFSQYGTQRYSVVYDLDGNWRVFRPNENMFFQPGWGPHK